MDSIKYGEKTCTLEFTFNSFKYMEDLDLSVMGSLESKPFKMIAFASQLLIGALNHDPKVKYDEDDVDAIMEEYLTEHSVAEIVEGLIGLLQESNFFKNLQKQTTTPKRKK